jgi:hypothetical protein
MPLKCYAVCVDHSGVRSPLMKCKEFSLTFQRALRWFRISEQQALWYMRIARESLWECTSLEIGAHEYSPHGPPLLCWPATKHNVRRLVDILTHVWVSAVDTILKLRRLFPVRCVAEQRCFRVYNGRRYDWLNRTGVILLEIHLA